MTRPGTAGGNSGGCTEPRILRNQHVDSLVCNPLYRAHELFGKLCAEGGPLLCSGPSSAIDHIRLSDWTQLLKCRAWFQSSSNAWSSLRTQNLGLNPGVLTRTAILTRSHAHRKVWEKNCAFPKATQTTALSVLTWQCDREEGNIFRPILHEMRLRKVKSFVSNPHVAQTQVVWLWPSLAQIS